MLASKQIDLLADTIKVALVTSSYSPNFGTDEFYSSISAKESTGAGYTAGGKTLTSKTFTLNTFEERWTFDAADTTWTTTTVSFRYAVIYDDSVASKPLIAAIDLGAQSATNQDLTIIWEYEGYGELGTLTQLPGILVFGYATAG